MSAVRYLADEDLRREIVTATRRLAPRIEFTTVVEAGLSGAPDEEVLEFAASRRSLVVSHDVSTMKAAAEQRLAAGQPMTGLSSLRSGARPATLPKAWS